MHAHQARTALFFPMQKGRVRYACFGCEVSWFDGVTCWACGEDTGVTYDDYIDEVRTRIDESRRRALREGALP